MWIRLTVALRSFINEPFWRSFNICFHKIKKKNCQENHLFNY